MMQFQWILFDADETLFHYNVFAGLELLYANYNLPFSTDDFKHFEVTNKALWIEYQNGKISAEHLQLERFASLSQRLNLSAQILSDNFFNDDDKHFKTDD